MCKEKQSSGRCTLQGCYQIHPKRISQKTDPDIQAYRTALSGLQLEDVRFGSKGNAILCDISTGQPRPVVPEGWRRRVFNVIHGLSHPSICTSRRLLVSKLVWHGLNKQVGFGPEPASRDKHLRSSSTSGHLCSPFGFLVAVLTTSTLTL